jgi:hypothetical protein
MDDHKSVAPTGGPLTLSHPLNPSLVDVSISAPWYVFIVQGGTHQVPQVRYSCPEGSILSGNTASKFCPRCVHSSFYATSSDLTKTKSTTTAYSVVPGLGFSIPSLLPFCPYLFPFLLSALMALFSGVCSTFFFLTQTPPPPHQPPYHSFHMHGTPLPPSTSPPSAFPPPHHFLFVVPVSGVSPPIHLVLC